MDATPPSSQESMHAATTFMIMQKAGCDVMQNLPKERWKAARMKILKCILATDMSDHFEFLSKLKLRVEAADFGPSQVESDRNVTIQATSLAVDSECEFHWFSFDVCRYCISR